MCTLLPVSAAWSAQVATAPDMIAKGKYLSLAAGCDICHTESDHHGAPFAGGRALHTQFGTFYTPNITPDKATGIGNWTEQDFRHALRQGILPGGSNLYPVFPYTSYTKMRNADITALWDYLHTLPPVHKVDKPHDLKWFAPPRFMVWFWKKLYFYPGRFKDNPKRSASWNRGAYLVNAVSHCAECHTPRNMLGGEKLSLRFAGSKNVPEKFLAPNITADPSTGIGNWSIGDIVEYLKTGLDPNGDVAGSVMADFITDGFSHMRDSDLKDIATYIKSLPPIKHSMRKKPKKHQQPNAPWD